MIEWHSEKAKREVIPQVGFSREGQLFHVIAAGDIGRSDTEFFELFR
jgi:hypothetical protein